MWFWLLMIMPYVVIMLLFVYAWVNMRSIVHSKHVSSPFVSIVLAVRNEEKTLEKLILAISKQKYQGFELIVVDDFSQDASFSISTRLSQQFSFLKIVKSAHQGKKKSIRQAIFLAQGELIVCIDADVYYPPTWLASILRCYETEQYDLLIAPVRMIPQNTLFAKLQALEFASLQASTAGSAYYNKAIMCNGANLAVKKAVYVAAHANLVDSEASGDDMFLLAAVKKMRGSVGYLYEKGAIVDIQPSDSFSGFLQQRMRWFSKSKSYTDIDVLVTSFSVFLAQIAIVGFAILSIFNVYYLPIFISLFLFKWFLDSLLLYKASLFFDQKQLVLYSFLLSVVYPFYVMLVAVCSMFCSIKWKGRKI